MSTYTQSRPAGGRRKFHAKPSFKRSGSKQPFSSSRPQSRFGGGSSRGGRSGGKGFSGAYINPAKFINKAQSVGGQESYAPKHTFNDFAIDTKLKATIAAKGYTVPTPIQDQAIPHILAGKDVVGIANTGTGKTAAFLVPLIHALYAKEKQHVMVLVPTRELAIQIEKELAGLARGTKLFAACLVGGAPIGPQLAQLRYPNHFIIGTPGRVKDMIERGKVRLETFDTIVLDEADRMLDMGFVADMRAVMQGMPEGRHTLFFSATMSPEIERLIGEFLRDPVRISVKTRDTAHNVEQDVVRVDRGAQKVDVLHTLLVKAEFTKVLVFGKTKHGVEKLSQALAERGVKAVSIHGNKTHANRQRALTSFRESRVQVLVATDVAARGLDIDSISHVINYDLPMTYDDYVHRIGRTGRGEKRGTALTFIEQR